MKGTKKDEIHFINYSPAKASTPEISTADINRFVSAGRNIGFWNDYNFFP
jgi:hypothetical protein